MDIKDIRHHHLLHHLGRFSKDEDFLAEVNKRLDAFPEYDSGFSPSYLSQLKSRKRDIGDKTARKFEAGLGLAKYAFEVLELSDPVSGDADPEFLELLKMATETQTVESLQAIADRVSPKDAMRIARFFLARAESGL